MKIHSFIALFKDTLQPIYPPHEVRAILSLLIETTMNLSLSQAIANSDLEATAEQLHLLNKALKGLENYEPIQYLLGHAWFYELKFKVTHDTLIPRNETEELVHLIINNHRNQKIKLLDIGTGSGCIAISLAKNLPAAEIHAIDISEKALHVAQENAKTNGVNVHFMQHDILNIQDDTIDPFDVIVSNPPYVTEAEKKLMSPNVLNNEPHSALFVPDSHPLIFYRAISTFSSKNLKEGGKLYFEINEQFPTETEKVMTHLGFTNCKSHKDLFGKYRITEGAYHEK